MAGGATTAALAAAVAGAGGFPFVAAGYKTPATMSDEIAAIRSTGLPFGVNLFAPSIVRIDPGDFRRYAGELQPDADRYGLDLSATSPCEDDDGWRAKVAVLVANPVPVVSVTFGVPPLEDVQALRRAGSQVLITVTTLAEAESAVAAGADGLVLQGGAAGGHSGTHDPMSAADPVDLVGLTRHVVASTHLPVVAAGGVDGPESFAALLSAGAVAVAVGTLLLLADESGATPTHRQALTDPRFTETVMTKAFTGRPARALRNSFIDRHDGQAPLGYPAVHHLTKDLRRAAATAGEPHDLHLWAGTGFRAARTGPAAAIVRWLTTGE
jgi:NAD(P)H-dependent flavin oxidoreductase YrpB (nitropropane dioxygenase family)